MSQLTIKNIKNLNIINKKTGEVLQDIDNPTTVPPSNIHTCPYCGESYFRENYSVSTAMYFPPVWKDGININPNRNITTTTCTCLVCGKCFSYQNK